MWAFMNICEWGSHQLSVNPNTPVIKPLKSAFNEVRMAKVQLVHLKVHLEVFIVCTACFSWAFGFCAPLFPIIMTQMVRVKYVTSQYMKDAWFNLDNGLAQTLPEFLY